ncbi:beta-N-acetylhexosaminidase [Rapidithrix thailandica]|uniref:beta-N-acetylhexosaminidase n=1 Tax=Rapidithrix thailandica TaxID=413964 RepID=A0AAW9SBR1_9BACT
MKKITTYLVLALVYCSAWGQAPEIIPAPASVMPMDGEFQLHKKAAIYSSNALKPLAEKLIAEIKDQGISLTHSSKQFSGTGIHLRLDPDRKDWGKEAYQLTISPQKIEIIARDEAGLFYGGQSLLQLVKVQEGQKHIKLACMKIGDQPRMAWRGLMLDESRHFFGKEKVKQLLDWMAYYKMNRFHWHLTDEPGWRIEIKKYPKLTEIGGKGNWHDPNATARYYTQDEIREIVAYAAERHIEIIPEIDMPGHATAANLAYPEFSGGGSKDYPDFTFHPGKEATYQYLTDILREVAELFPSSWIHLGGDEVHFGNKQWASDVRVQALMEREGYTSLREVEFYFINRMADSVKQLGKKVIGWDEVIEANLPTQNTLVMWWRHNLPAQLDRAIHHNYQVVLCPRIPLYFDFVQHDSHQYGRRWNGFSELSGAYGYPDNTHQLNDKQMEQVVGIQANVWSERIADPKRLDFMTFPRICAVAEAAWTPASQKNYESFILRLKTMLPQMDQDNVYYFNPFDINAHPEPKGVEKAK